MVNIEERKCIIELLRLYRSFPALWDPKHKDYNNYFLKHQQYEILLAKYRETYPNGYMRDLKKRMTSLRNIYKREMKRLARERTSTSTCYYFKELSFLSGIETTHASQKLQQRKCSNDEERKTSLTENMALSPPTTESFYQILSDNNIEIEEIEIKPDLDLLLGNYNVNDPTHFKIEPKNQQIKQEIYQQPQSISIYSHELPNMESQQNKDELILLPYENYKQIQDTCQPLCSVWAEKLQQIDTSQREFAEKLINEVVFNAQLGLLNFNTCITNLSRLNSVPRMKEKNVK